MIIKKYTGSGLNIVDEAFTKQELISISENPITSKLRNAANNTIMHYQGDEPNEEFIILAIREVAAWKVKSILKLQGLFETIENALTQLEEPTKTIADMAWKHAESINQFSPTVLMIKQLCNLTDEQVKNIFDDAEKINI